MDISEVLSATGGPNPLPAKPDGGSNVQPLNPLGPDRVGAEPAPPNVTAQQGAGGGYLYPGAQGQASDGNVEPGNDDHYAQDGPEPVPFQSGIPSLTAGVVNRPAGGDQPFSEPVGRPDHALGRDQSMGQGINPMLKPANAPRQPGEGLFK